MCPAEKLHTQFAEVAPERAARRIGPAIVRAMGDLELQHEREHRYNPLTEEPTAPIGLIAQYLRREHPVTSDGEILAALHWLDEQGHIEARPRDEPHRLTDLAHRFRLHPLNDGRSIHTSTLWVDGEAHHHFALPPGGTGEGTALNLEREATENKPHEIQA
jgi:hypothetical protein